MGPPVVAVAGPVLLMARSAASAASPLSLHDALPILAAFGSGSLPPMVAVLVMVPAAAGAVALIVIVALAPEASEPTAQVERQGARVQVRREVMADVEPRPEGRVSVTVAPVAASGPLF